ncbi:MAG: hypothetical protein K0S01_71 [Herbinix sp.]|jgi:hypothetical protein|nr:hypothetical protein [Herbinix sp.]
MKIFLEIANLMVLTFGFIYNISYLIKLILIKSKCNGRIYFIGNSFDLTLTALSTVISMVGVTISLLTGEATYIIGLTCCIFISTRCFPNLFIAMNDERLCIRQTILSIDKIENMNYINFKYEKACRCYYIRYKKDFVTLIMKNGQAFILEDLLRGSRNYCSSRA